MSSADTVRVFIGSGEASLLERKVLIYSLQKHSQRKLDLYVFNGTHNTVERNDDPPFLTSMSLRAKYKNATEFSYYRFLIPEICNFQGKAIWLDSDIIVRADIGELFDSPIEGYDVLAKKLQHSSLPPEIDPRCPAIIVLNCETCRFNLESLLDDIDQQHYTDKDLMYFSNRFREFHSLTVGEFESNWNIRDFYDADTKLIHYTNLTTQPWKYPKHPYGELWFEYFREAIAAGYVTQRDIDLSISRAAVRLNLMEGNSPRPEWQKQIARSTIHYLKKLPRAFKKSSLQFNR